MCFVLEGRGGRDTKTTVVYRCCFARELLANTCVLGYLGWLILDFIFWSHLIFDIFTV